MGDNAINATALKSYVERVERVDQERRDRVEDIKQIIEEAKSEGFNGKMIRMAVRERAKDSKKRDSERLEAETYLAALGLI